MLWYLTETEQMLPLLLKHLGKAPDLGHIVILILVPSTPQLVEPIECFYAHVLQVPRLHTWGRFLKRTYLWIFGALINPFSIPLISFSIGTFLRTTSHHLHSLHWVSLGQSMGTVECFRSKEWGWQIRVASTWAAMRERLGAIMWVNHSTQTVGQDWHHKIHKIEWEQDRHSKKKTSMVSSKEPGRKRPEAQSAAPSTSSSGSVSANGSASMKTNPEWSTDAKKRSFNMFNGACIYIYTCMNIWLFNQKIKHNIHHSLCKEQCASRHRPGIHQYWHISQWAASHCTFSYPLEGSCQAILKPIALPWVVSYLNLVFQQILW